MIVGSVLAHHLAATAKGWKRLLILAVPLIVMVDLVAHRWMFGFAVQTERQEAVYDQIASDPRDCVVLEVPVGVRTGTDRIGPGELLTFYQPIHRKRLVNGLVARAPLHALAYYRASPALMFLAHETPPAGNLEADLRRQLVDLRIGYVVIHTDMMDAAWVQQTLALFDHLERVRRLETDSQVVAFRVD